MKLDYDLLREILLAIENYEPDRIGNIQMIHPSQFSGTDPQNYHHIRLLTENGFIDAAGRPTLQLEYAIHGPS